MSIPNGTRVRVSIRPGRRFDTGDYHGQTGTVAHQPAWTSPGQQWVRLDHYDVDVVLFTDELIPLTNDTSAPAFKVGDRVVRGNAVGTVKFVSSLDDCANVSFDGRYQQFSDSVPTCQLRHVAIEVDEDEPIEQMMNRQAPLGAGASSSSAAAAVSPPSSSSAAAAATSSPVVVTPAAIARYCEWMRTTRAAVPSHIHIRDLPPAMFLCPHCTTTHLRLSQRMKLYLCTTCERKWDSSRDHFPTKDVSLEQAAAQRNIVAVPNMSIGSALKEMSGPPTYEEASKSPTLAQTIADEEASAEKRKAQRKLKRKDREDKDASNKAQRL